jgi:hypothetical protein
MKDGDYDHVRMILRGRAASGITQADVQRRARELSLRRTGSENYTAEDIEDAERELLIGRDPAALLDDADATFSSVPDMNGSFAIEGQMYDSIDSLNDDVLPPAPAPRHARKRRRTSH